MIQTQGLQFIVHHVADVAAARMFYAETLGFAINTDSPTFVQFQNPSGAVFAISLKDDEHTDVELWWAVTDADAAHNELATRGVEILQPLADQPFGRTFAIRDVAGQPLYFFQPHAARA